VASIEADIQALTDERFLRELLYVLATTVGNYGRLASPAAPLFEKAAQNRGSQKPVHRCFPLQIKLLQLSPLIRHALMSADYGVLCSSSACWRASTSPADDCRRPVRETRKQKIQAFEPDKLFKRKKSRCSCQPEKSRKTKQIDRLLGFKRPKTWHARPAGIEPGIQGQ